MSNHEILIAAKAGNVSKVRKILVTFAGRMDSIKAEICQIFELASPEMTKELLATEEIFKESGVFSKSIEVALKKLVPENTREVVNALEKKDPFYAFDHEALFEPIVEAFETTNTEILKIFLSAKFISHEVGELCSDYSSSLGTITAGERLRRAINKAFELSDPKITKILLNDAGVLRSVLRGDVSGFEKAFRNPVPENIAVFAQDPAFSALVKKGYFYKENHPSLQELLLEEITKWEKANPITAKARRSH